VTREFAQLTTGPTDELYEVRMDQPDPGRSGQHGPGGTAALDHPERAASTTGHVATGDALAGDARTGGALTSGQVTGKAPADDAATGRAVTDGAHTGPPPAGTSRPDRRSALATLQGIAGRPAVQHLGLLIGYIVAGIVVTWPRVTYLAGRLPASSDSASYAWGFWWVAHQVTHLGNPWFTHYLAAPVGVQLGFDTLMPLVGLLMTPVTLAFGPSVAVNLLVVVLPGLLCYTMYRVARLWLPSPAGAIAAGAFFGLSTMITQQDWYHLNIAIGELFLPMALEATVRLRRRPDARRAIILGLVLGGVVLVNQESAILALILSGLALLPWLARRPFAEWLKPAALASLVAAVIASPQVIVMTQQVLAGGASSRPGALARWDVMYGAGLSTLFAPSPRVASAGLTSVAALYHYGHPDEAVPTFGVVLTVLAVLGAVLAWRRTSTRLLTLLWAAAAALALGPRLIIGNRTYIPVEHIWHGTRVSEVMPYTWLIQIPGLAGFREADRFVLLGIIPAALLAGRGLGWLLSHAKPVAVVAIALGVLEAGFSSVGPVMPTTMTALDRPIAADHSGDIVVDVPFGLRGGVRVYAARIPPASLLLATADGHPRAVSYSSWVPERSIAGIAGHEFYAGLVAAEFGSQGSATQLRSARDDARRLKVGWVLIWRWKPLVSSYLPSVGFHFAYRADGVTVYRANSLP
jgi:hypothetical protein